MRKKKGFTQPQIQVVVIKKTKEFVAFEQDACNRKVGCLQALLRRDQDACYHVARRHNKKEDRFNADFVAAANKDEEKVSHSLSSASFLHRK